MSLVTWKKTDNARPDDRDITRVLKAAGPATADTADQYGEHKKLQKRAARDIVADIDQNELAIRQHEERIREWRARDAELRAELAESLNAIDELTSRYRDQYLGKPDGEQAEKTDGQNHPKCKKRRVPSRSE